MTRVHLFFGRTGAWQLSAAVCACTRSKVKTSGSVLRSDQRHSAKRSRLCVNVNVRVSMEMEDVFSFWKVRLEVSDVDSVVSVVVSL